MAFLMIAAYIKISFKNIPGTGAIFQSLDLEPLNICNRSRGETLVLNNTITFLRRVILRTKGAISPISHHQIPFSENI